MGFKRKADTREIVCFGVVTNQAHACGMKTGASFIHSPLIPYVQKIVCSAS